MSRDRGHDIVTERQANMDLLGRPRDGGGRSRRGGHGSNASYGSSDESSEGGEVRLMPDPLDPSYMMNADSQAYADRLALAQEILEHSIASAIETHDTRSDYQAMHGASTCPACGHHRGEGYRDQCTCVEVDKDADESTVHKHWWQR